MSTPTTVSPQAPADLVELGRIVSAYGVRGWVKVQPHSSNSQVLLKSKTWWLQAPVPKIGLGALSLPYSVGVVACRPQGATVVAQLDAVADRDQAEALKGHTVWVPRADFPPADDNEYYWVDLIGCAFYSDADGEPTRVGVVDDVTDNGAHAILRVVLQSTPQSDAEPETRLDAKGRPLEMLVPFVAAHILTVDLAARRIDSNWPTEF